ncbi:hypothetical protein GCM10023196_036860 [Actinoallomurus vinaceus]|uniref:Minor tail protein n=1 Tax=Actinoallomurus vinaceus TaxID=1080074 RepID=A0ABP8UCZ0_9ACTN
MPVAVASQWTATGANWDTEVITNPAPGNWLVAIVAARCVDGTTPLLGLSDPARNIWQLLAIASGPASAVNGQIQAEVWACPAARYDGWPWLPVYAAAMAISASDVGSVAVNVIELSGMGNGQLTVDAIATGTATQVTSLSLPVPAPPSGTNVVLGVAATDNGTPAAITATGVGFTPLTQVSRSGPNVVATSQWQAATGATTATWSSGSTKVNWAGVAVSFRTVGALPSQPNPNWPITRLNVGLGYQLSTPLSRVWWTDQTTRLTDDSGRSVVHAPRGIPYDQGIAQSEQATIGIRNDDGAYSPRHSGAATATAAGTTTTILVPTAQTANINRSDFFRLQTNGGVLKELTVFQVTGISTVGGTTTITFTRADGTPGGAAVATGAGDQFVGIPIDLYIPWQMQMYWQGKWYTVATGWLGELPQSWEDAHWGEAAATGIDALATLTAANLSPLAGEIMRRSPTHYWPCSDPSGTGYAANASGFSNVALQQVQSKYGAGASNTADFGAATQGVDSGLGFKTSIVGDPGTGWQQSGLTQADGAAHKGFALVAQGSDFPSIANGVTIIGTTIGTDNTIGSGSYDCTLMMVRNGNPGQGSGGSLLKLFIPHPQGGVTKVMTWDKNTHAATTTSGPAGTGLGGTSSDPDIWAITFNQSSWTAYIDGASWSGACNLPASFSTIDVGGEADAFFAGSAFNGIHAHIAIFPRILTDAEILQLTNASRYAIPLSTGNISGWDTTSRRVQRKLDTVAWRGARAITSSPLVMDVEDASANGSITQVATDMTGAEDAAIFVDAAGQFQVRSRQYSYYQAVRAALGDGPGEIPFQPGGTYGYNTTYVYNNVTIANTKYVGGGEMAAQTLTAVDDTSTQRYGSRTLSRDTRLYYAADAWHLSWWLLSRFAYPQIMVDQIVIEPASNPAAWAFCLSVEVGDILIVNRRPIGAPMISARCRVLRVEPDLGADLARWTLQLGPAPAPVPITGDPAAGVLGGTVLGA